ncbi:MAG: O-antigen ligase family protein [Candidatus Omnitrophota bacterium]
MENIFINRANTPIAVRRMDRALEFALYFLVVGVSISNALASIGVGAVLLAWVFRKIILREKLIVPKILIVLAGVLLLSYAASLIYSEFLGQSLHALFLKYGKYLVLMLAIADGVREKRVAVNMAVFLCLTAVLLSFDGFYQFFVGRDLLLFREAGRLDVYNGFKEVHFPRITSTFPAANTFASYLVPVLMLGLPLSFFYGPKTQKSSFVKGICLGCIVLSLLLTFSRGGIIACLAGVFALAFLLRKKILWVIPVIFLVAFLFGMNLYGSRADRGDAMDPTVRARLLMLQDATRMFQTHPWTGIGLNTYYKTCEKSSSLTIPPSYAHNSYIQMLTEVGIVGFMSFMALMIYWFSCGLRSLKKSFDPELKFLLAGTLAGVLGLCVASFFDNVLFELLPATLFWILMGYGVALAKTGSGKVTL